MNHKLKLLWNKGVIRAFEILLKFIYAKISGKPEALMIEPTDKCNLKCTICYTQNNPLKRKNHFMSFGQFKKIIDEVKWHIIYITFNSYP